MGIIVDFLVLILGFYALIKGADIFVDGSSGMARAFHVPGVIIGLTIVAMGTSAPELAVSTSAALKGANEIALSNVLGSNIFNILIVLGICAMINPMTVDKVIMKRDYPMSLGITLVLLLFTSGSFIFSGSFSTFNMLDNVGMVNRICAFTFLAIFIICMAFLIIDAKKNPVDEENIANIPIWKCIFFIILGIALIIAGGQGVVYGAKEIAKLLGMSETLIGLTIVAVGTSLPELVTSIVAARKGETGMAVGNVIGSNIFNILLILGISAMIRPIGVNLASVFDIIILILVSMVTWIFIATSKRLTKIEGFLMVLFYILYMIFAIIR